MPGRAEMLCPSDCQMGWAADVRYCCRQRENNGRHKCRWNRSKLTHSGHSHWSTVLHLHGTITIGRRFRRRQAAERLAGAHDVAVQMIDRPIVRVHQYGAASAIENNRWDGHKGGRPAGSMRSIPRACSRGDRPCLYSGICGGVLLLRINRSAHRWL